MWFWDNERVPSKQSVDMRSWSTNNAMQNSWKGKWNSIVSLQAQMITKSNNMPLKNYEIIQHS